jgi:hypothetical protein
MVIKTSHPYRENNIVIKTSHPTPGKWTEFRRALIEAGMNYSH